MNIKNMIYYMINVDERQVTIWLLNEKLADGLKRTQTLQVISKPYEFSPRLDAPPIFSTRLIAPSGTSSITTTSYGRVNISPQSPTEMGIFHDFWEFFFCQLIFTQKMITSSQWEYGHAGIKFQNDTFATFWVILTNQHVTLSRLVSNFLDFGVLNQAIEKNIFWKSMPVNGLHTCP